MCKLCKLTKRKYRHLLSAQIKSAVEARETRIFTGRMKSAFASLLGNKQEPFLYDLMEREDGTQSADRVEIHRTFQHHFKQHFSTNPDSLMQQLGLDLPKLQSAHRLERLMDHPDEMVAAYMGTVDTPSVCKVPREYVQLIAEAFQRTPAACQVELKIEAAMATSFSFEEFRAQVNGGGNSAGGGSGDTYRLLQVAPEEVQREIFHILLTFFEACETPDQWKQVILYLIQKDLGKLPLPANFRPVGLLEVLRKVWTKMIFARITPIINEGGVLQDNHYAFLPGKGTGSELILILNLLEEVVEHGLWVDLSTSDVSGAFDSPERTAQYICWRRAPRTPQQRPSRRRAGQPERNG
jgi:hypothetical protein